MIVPSPQYRLSSAENERIFREDIAPHVLSGARPQGRPVVVFKAQHYAISQRYNVVIETTVRSPAEFENLIPAAADERRPQVFC